MFGLLADASGGIGLLQLAYGEVENLISPDLSLQDVLNAIQVEFSQLQGQVAASDKLQRMRDVDLGINPAVAVFEQLPAIMASTPPEVRISDSRKSRPAWNRFCSLRIMTTNGRP